MRKYMPLSILSYNYFNVKKSHLKDLIFNCHCAELSDKKYSANALWTCSALLRD